MKLNYRATEGWPYHVSAGGVVVKGGQVLLLKRHIEPSGLPGGYHLPKGTLEVGETLEAAAMREIEEEAGVIAEAQTYLGSINRQYELNDKSFDKTTHYFLCQFGKDSESGMDDEHDERAWVDWDEAIDLLSQMPKGEAIILKRARKALKI